MKIERRKAMQNGMRTVGLVFLTGVMMVLLTCSCAKKAPEAPTAPPQGTETTTAEETKFGDLEIIFSADCEWLEPKAQEEMNSALDRFPEIDAVYGHNDPSAHGAWVAAQAEGKGREETIKFIGIDALPHEGVAYVRKGILTASFEYPNGAKEGIDLALKILALAGEALKQPPGEARAAAVKAALAGKIPKTITLGTRIFTKENVDRGGEVLAEAETSEVAGVAGELPPLSGKWVIGMSQCNRAEPWREQMDSDIEKYTGQHPELKVLFKDAANDSNTQQDQVRELIEQGVHLLIISPKEAKPLTAPVKEAYDKGIPVIVLDRKVEGEDYTCFIGADNVKIGREAGKYLAKILGGKGKIVELKGLMTSTPGQERHQGFLEGLRAYVEEQRQAAPEGEPTG